MENTKNTSAKSSINSLNHKGTVTSDNKMIANAFNEYFTTIGNELAKQIKDTGKSKLDDYMNKPVSSSIFLTPVNDIEVQREINKLKLGKAAGIDAIPSKILKAASGAIIPNLVHIFNLAFTAGIYPDALKVSKVVPIFKKGDNKLPENYRPISLLSCINKLLEKAIEKRLRDFIDKNNLFYEYQFGFRKKYSTCHALLDMTNNIYKHLNAGENVLGLYLDLKKAFDTVDHTILLRKMNYYGIRGTANQLLT